MRVDVSNTRAFYMEKGSDGAIWFTMSGGVTAGGHFTYEDVVKLRDALTRVLE